MSRIHRTLPLIVGLVLSVLAVSCNAVAQLNPLGPLVDKLDRLTAIVGRESTEWQAEADKISRELPEALGEEARSTIQRGVMAAGAQAHCGIDFVRQGVRADLARIRARLLGEPVPAQEARICNTDPADRVIFGRTKTLVISGYNLDKQRAQVFLVSAGKRTALSNDYFTDPTHYSLVLDLASRKLQRLMSSEAQRFEIRYGSGVVKTILVDASQLFTIYDNRNYAYPSGEFSDNTNPPSATCRSGFAVKGLICASGKYCDNMKLICAPYMEGGDTEGSRTWTSAWISDEKDRNTYQSAKGFVTGMACRGDYCDDIRLQTMTSPYLKNARQCGTVETISEEAGRNESRCPMGAYVAGVTCSGKYCDNVTLICCAAAR